MKKIFVALLALIMCLGCFTACDLFGGNEPATEGAATLAEAVQYLRSIYKDSAKETPADYDVVGKVVIGDTTFTVTWATNNESITVKESSKAGFYTIDLPAKNETPVDYVLTATISDANGASESISFERALPVYDASAIVSRPEEGVAYKFYMVHASLGQTLFATGETQDNANKYILSTTDPKAAPDFYVEADGEGFKFYTEINGVKTYIKAAVTTSDDGKVSKYIGYSAEEGTTWTYKSDTNGWYTTLEGTEYVVGTYGTYNTFCISEGSFLTVENTGKTQFPAGVMLKEVAEAMTPSAGPVIYETPEEIVNAVYDLDLGGVLSGGHKYTLTGVITTINSPYDAGYGNITVTIVVNGMEDKPIECFRLKGEGIENLTVGDTITVNGELLKYNNNTETGKVEFNAGCTLVSGDFCNHTEEILAGKAATCTEAGLTEGKRCTTCEKTLVEQTEIAALGHEWNTVLANDANNHWTACTRCDETKDKAAHNNGSDSVCDDCGYGCAHTDKTNATCGAASVCNACGTTLAPATGEHTYTDAADATCNVCGFERELSETVVIYYPKDNKYVTGIEYLYEARNKMQLTLSENKADAIALQVIRNADGTISFMAEGKYLYADNTSIEFVDAAGENTLFVEETASGGIFIRCNTANYNGNPQYLEVYSGYLTIYGMGTDPSIYTFVLQSADGASGKIQEVAKGDAPAGGASSVPNGVSSVSTDASYKLAGVNATGTLFFDGTAASGRINGSATGITVKLEAAAAAGEYYIYFMDGNTKTYIAVAGDDDSSDFALVTEKTDAGVWVIDASAKTIVSKQNPKRGMATQNTSTYSNFSTYAVSNFGADPIYVPCWFVAA